jgi:hypothetical protein
MTGTTMVRAKGMLRDAAAKPVPVPAGQWCTLDITAFGDRLQVAVNGKIVGNLVDQAREFPRGRIILCQQQRAVVEFRNIEIKEWGMPVPAQVVAADGFVPLFNGKDLTGWKTTRPQPGGWQVVDGILRGTGPNLGQLYTLRNDYGDFHLRAEARVSDHGASMLCLRHPHDPDYIARDGSLAGYAVRLSGLADGHKTGSLTSYEKIGVRSLTAREATVPGEWFTLEILAQGDHVTTKVNGRVAADFLNPQPHVRGGRFVLGYLFQWPQTVIEYRKIDIKEILAVAPPPQPPPERPLGAFVALLNGKDLAGWRAAGKDGWQVGAEGELIGHGPAPALLTSRGDYRSFIARLELSASVDVEALFTLRQQGEPDGKANGLTARLKGDGTLVRAGYLGFDHHTAVSSGIEVQPDTWFQLEFHVLRESYRVTVNGKGLAGMGYAPDRYPPGALGLHLTKGTLRIKKFEISAEVPAGPPVPEPPPPVKEVIAAREFVPLFNGKDLAGWQPHAKRPGNWRVENGVLISSAPVGGSLYTTRGDYQDFHLRAEVRINDKGFGRLFVRAAYDPNKVPFKVLGFDAMINQRPLGSRMGSLQATSLTTTSRAAAEEVPAAPGEWAVLEVLARGERINVLVNGKAVAEIVDEMRQFARSGHIALHQDANAVIEFRKVEIKEGPPGP